MRVVRLQAENFKRLSAVDINVDDGGLVVVSGRNAQGKSSVLDAMWAALGGGSAVPERPITDGAKRGEVSVTMDAADGPLVVTRRFTPKNRVGTLTVTNGEGATFKSPQQMLDGFLGALTFDPLAFAEMKPADQRATLLQVVDVGIDLDENAAGRERAYEQRTVVGRDVKRLEGALASLPDVPTDTPEKPVNVADLSDQIEAATNANIRNDAARRTLALMVGDVQRALDDEKAGAAELKLLVAERKRREKAVAAANADIEADPLEDVDLTPLREQIAAADAVNAAVQVRSARLTVQGQLEEAQGKTDSLTAEIDALDVARREALAAADMPLPGLGFDEDGVTLDDVPFSQAAGSERLRASTALGMALNPELRVLRITDGSLLDSDGMGDLADLAAEHDFDIWVERVADAGEGIGIVIENGEVVSDE